MKNTINCPPPDPRFGVQNQPRLYTEAIRRQSGNSEDVRRTILQDTANRWEERRTPIETKIRRTVVNIDSRNRQKNPIVQTTQLPRPSSDPFECTPNNRTIYVHHPNHGIPTTGVNQVIIKDVSPDENEGTTMRGIQLEDLNYDPETGGPLFLVTRVIPLLDTNGSVVVDSLTDKIRSNAYEIELPNEVIPSLVGLGRGGGSRVKIELVTDRDEGYPTTSHYKINLGRTFRNVYMVKLISSEIPNYVYTISDRKIRSTAGIISAESKINNKLRWVNEDEGITFLDKVPMTDDLANTSLISTNLLNQSLTSQKSAFAANVETFVQRPEINDDYLRLTTEKNTLVDDFKSPDAFWDKNKWPKDYYHTLNLSMAKYFRDIKVNPSNNEIFKNYMPASYYHYWLRQGNTDALPDYGGYFLIDTAENDGLVPGSGGIKRLIENKIENSQNSFRVFPLTRANSSAWLAPIRIPTIHDTVAEIPTKEKLTYPVHEVSLDSGSYSINTLATQIEEKLSKSVPYYYDAQSMTFAEVTQLGKSLRQTRTERASSRNIFHVEGSTTQNTLKIKQYRTIYEATIKHEEGENGINIFKPNESCPLIFIEIPGHNLLDGDKIYIENAPSLNNVGTNELNGEHIVRVPPEYEIDVRMVFPIPDILYIDPNKFIVTTPGENVTSLTKDGSTFALNTSNLALYIRSLATRAARFSTNVAVSFEETIKHLLRTRYNPLHGQSFEAMGNVRGTSATYKTNMDYQGSRLVNQIDNGVGIGSGSTIDTQGIICPFLEGELIMLYRDLSSQDSTVVFGRISRFGNNGRSNRNGNFVLQYSLLNDSSHGNFRLGDVVVGLETNSIAVIVPKTWGANADEFGYPTSTQITAYLNRLSTEAFGLEGQVSLEDLPSTVPNGDRGVFIKTTTIPSTTILNGKGTTRLRISTPVKFKLITRGLDTPRELLGLPDEEENNFNSFVDNTVRKDIIEIEYSYFLPQMDGLADNYLFLQTKDRVNYEVGETLYLEDHNVNPRLFRRRVRRELRIDKVEPLRNYMRTLAVRMDLSNGGDGSNTNPQMPGYRCYFNGCPTIHNEPYNFINYHLDDLDRFISGGIFQRFTYYYFNDLIGYSGGSLAIRDAIENTLPKDAKNKSTIRKFRVSYTGTPDGQTSFLNIAETSSITYKTLGVFTEGMHLIMHATPTPDIAATPTNFDRFVVGKVVGTELPTIEELIDTQANVSFYDVYVDLSDTSAPNIGSTPSFSEWLQQSGLQKTYLQNSAERVKFRSQFLERIGNDSISSYGNLLQLYPNEAFDTFVEQVLFPGQSYVNVEFPGRPYYIDESGPSGIINPLLDRVAYGNITLRVNNFINDGTSPDNFSSSPIPAANCYPLNILSVMPSFSINEPDRIQFYENDANYDSANLYLLRARFEKGMFNLNEPLYIRDLCNSSFLPLELGRIIKLQYTYRDNTGAIQSDMFLEQEPSVGNISFLPSSPPNNAPEVANTSPFIYDVYIVPNASVNFANLSLQMNYKTQESIGNSRASLPVDTGTCNGRMLLSNQSTISPSSTVQAQIYLDYAQAIFPQASLEYFYSEYLQNKCVVSYTVPYTKDEIDTLNKLRPPIEHPILANNLITYQPLQYQDSVPLHTFDQGDIVYIFDHLKKQPYYTDTAFTFENQPDKIQEIATNTVGLNDFQDIGISSENIRILSNLWPGVQDNNEFIADLKPGRNVLIDLDFSENVEKGFMQKGRMRVEGMKHSIVGDRSIDYNKTISEDLSSPDFLTLSSSISAGANQITLTGNLSYIEPNSVLVIESKYIDNEYYLRNLEERNISTGEFGIVDSITLTGTNTATVTLRNNCINDHDSGKYVNPRFKALQLTSEIISNTAHVGNVTGLSNNDVVIFDYYKMRDLSELPNDGNAVAWFGNVSLSSTNLTSIFTDAYRLKDLRNIELSNSFAFTEQINRIVEVFPTNNSILLEKKPFYPWMANTLILTTSTPSNTTPTIKYNVLSTQPFTVDDQWYTRIFYQGHPSLNPGATLLGTNPHTFYNAWLSGVKGYNTFSGKKVFIGGMKGVSLPNQPIENVFYNNYINDNPVLTRSNRREIDESIPIPDGQYKLDPYLQEDRNYPLVFGQNVLNIDGIFQRPISASAVGGFQRNWIDREPANDTRMPFPSIVIKGRYFGYGGFIEEVQEETKHRINDSDGFKVLDVLSDARGNRNGILLNLKQADMPVLGENVNDNLKRRIVSDIAAHFNKLPAQLTKPPQFRTADALTQLKIVGTGGTIYRRVINKPVDPASIRYINLAIPKLQSIYNTSDSDLEHIFAKISITNDVGSTEFNTFVSAPKVFDKQPLASLNSLEVAFLNPDGSLVDFLNTNHSFTLEIFEIVDTVPFLNPSAGRLEY